MKRISSCVGSLALVFTYAGSAVAEPTVQGLTLGVERVFGFTAVTATDEGDAATTSQSSIGFGLGNTSGAAPALFTIPRVNVDYVLPMGLSFGGALGFRTLGITNEVDGGPLSVTTESSATAFLFAPRVGYLVGLNEQFGIWPRLGFSYVAVSTDDDDGEDDDFSQSYGALTLEAPLMFMPHRTFGFVVAPSLDLGISGSREVNGEDYDGDLSLSEFGFTFGMFVAL